MAMDKELGRSTSKYTEKAKEHFDKENKAKNPDAGRIGPCF